jgi:prepilin-type N-terminal cleavage/methylation domain-containing protein
MSKSFPKSHDVPRGFTLVELMVAMVLTLILLGMAFNIFDKLNNAADLAGTMADVNENLRAGENMIARDLSTAGANIPLGGFPLPSGGTPCKPIPVPLPAWLPAQVFNPACGNNMNVITPGSGFGPTSGSGGTKIPTDSVTLITVNPTSQLNEFQLSSISPITTTPGAYCCFPAGTTSVTITVNPGTNGGNLTAAGSSQVVPGQLIMLSNANTSVLLAVSTVGATTITCTTGDAANDPLGLNQFPLSANSPTAGTVAQLQTTAAPAANFYPATYAYQINMTTYYLDNASRAPIWMLMKQVGTGAPMTGAPPTVPSQPPQPVAMGINVLQFAYSLSPPAVPTDPTRTFVAPYTPNTIRKVNLWLTAMADHPNRKSGLYYTNSMGTSVTAQNLAYYNQY